ncbi:MAG: hypothetical protein NT154_14990 [Verrucomicrobia bacterium]|nr:hypothetical protein [Verrucomicrobiota bacterium]
MMPENTIRPELVAAKLASADNLERPELAEQIKSTPRLVEMVWFIQWRSFQPGGLSAFSADLLATFPERFISRDMQKAGAVRGGRYNLKQSLLICKGFWRHLNGSQRLRTVSTDTGLETFKNWMQFHIHPELTIEAIQQGSRCDREKILAGFDVFNWEFFKSQCEEIARCDLSGFLRDMCVEKSTDFKGTSYCPELLQTLFDFMDRHAMEAERTFARTEVAEKVFDALDYAWAEKKAVRIDGNSRFGKSEGLKVWAAKYPGRMRLLTVPPSNAESDLIRAVAEPLGTEVSFGARGLELRDKVEFILRHGKLGLLLDEAHNLLPVRYGRNTVPGRLNWVRAEVMDRHLPCALVTTPQTFNAQSSRFVKHTGFNFAQWDGRIAMTVRLPDALGKHDLAAVAKIHFPELGEKQLEAITAAAMYSESYLKAVEDISSRARWIARRRRSDSVAAADIRAAICDVVLCATELLRAGAPQDNPAARAKDEQPAAPARTRRETTAGLVRSLCPGATETDLCVNRLTSLDTEQPSPAMISEAE